eukprot:923784-Rhodomonas_salina.1
MLLGRTITQHGDDCGGADGVSIASALRKPAQTSTLVGPARARPSFEHARRGPACLPGDGVRA